MSRFYYALKEASRSAKLAPEAPVATEPETSALDEIPIPPLFPEGAEGRFTVGGPAHDAADLDPLNSLLKPRQDEPIGTLTQIAVDETARLIPQAVDQSVVEGYRRLRTKILQQQQRRAFRSVVVASPNPQEGKTITCLNLGLSFAMLPNFKVLVIDGDLRRGTLGKLLGVEGQGRAGFSNLIEGSASLEDVVLKSDDNPLYFMVRGTSQLLAAELLHSDRLSSHFRRMAEEFDLILVDSPPVNLLTDTQQLAASCDAVLLVARAFSTSRKALERAAQDLSQFRIIGSVLNAGTRVARRYGYYGYGGKDGQ